MLKDHPVSCHEGTEGEGVEVQVYSLFNQPLDGVGS